MMNLPLVVAIATAGFVLAEPAPTKAPEKRPAAKAAGEAADEKKTEVTLKAGDAAPKLEVETFIKGKEVKSFEAGKVYVVEFWATWCGPCIKAFPHLSELQKKHGDKVTIIGVNIWERKTLDEVKKFVEEQGDKMGYTVAFDGKAKKMADNWMKAAGRNGIPSAFIVNGEGKIAWIGHPASMDAELDKAVKAAEKKTAAK